MSSIFISRAFTVSKSELVNLKRISSSKMLLHKRSFILTPSHKRWFRTSTNIISTITAPSKSNPSSSAFIKSKDNRLSSTGFPEVDANFSNAQEAFKSKTTGEVFRACFVFHLLTINYLVDNQMMLMKLMKKTLGEKLFEKFMEMTFYGHFVAGKDETEIAPKIKRMQKFGVNAILDYSAEEDIPEVTPILEPDTSMLSDKDKKDKGLKIYEEAITDGSQRKTKSVARTYFYRNEAVCDKNMDIFLNSIRAVAGTTDGVGFAAVKATALAKPKLLVLRLSEAIERVHCFVEYLTGVRDAVGNQPIPLDKLKARFEKAAKDDPAVQAWLDGIDADAEGVINLLPWKSILIAKRPLQDAMRIPNIETGKLEPLSKPFSEEEIKAFENALKRCHTIFTVARGENVRVMVDAEQTYLQPAISRMTIEMMKIYNTDKPIVFNTYQCYLKNAYHSITTDLNQAKRQNFYFGAKLVRGAYLDQERQRAKDLGYEDPVQPTYQDTTAMYQKCMDECLQRIKKNKELGQPQKVKVMAASHNEDTVRFMIKKMKEYGIRREENVVSFGQLYGMCDQVSFPLGQSGYQVFKYIPYGPVAEVLPYLSRRAQENRGFLGKTSKERQLLREELWRRIKSREFNYNPDNA